MQSAPSVSLTVLLSCATLFGQFATPATQPQTFHIRGTITDPLDAVIPGVKVTFQSEQLTKTVTTDDVGVYVADLPLGDYTMTAQGVSGFRPYRRPLFRVMSPASPILNATLLVGNPCGDMIEVSSENSAMPEKWKADTTQDCRHEESFQVPSGDQLPLQLSIRYGGRTLSGSGHTYTGEKTRQYETPVFVAYNLFSLQAAKVTYDAKNRTIGAIGNVVVVNESGATQHADSMTFRIENGQAVPVP